ncbi:uncharacterized protein [Centruroides vittatus]|uniref:uncharacterized protein n=1 Tax=Centruroides vittatus TaxID=120091 RepID=UPI00350F2303
MDCRANKCFCFSNNQDASFASGVYTTIISLLGTVYIGTKLSYYVLYGPSGHIVYKEISLSGIAIFLALLLCSITLLHAVRKEIRLMLIPWMVCMIILITIQYGSLILFLATVFEILHPIHFISLMIMVAMISLHTYCFVIVKTYYQKLKVEFTLDEKPKIPTVI